MAHGEFRGLLSRGAFVGARCYNVAQVHMRKLLFPVCSALFLLLAGCSETSTKTAEKKKEAEKLEPIGGQSAIYKMYQVARSWAPDAQVLKLNSMMLTEVPDVPKGTAAAWQATFVSANRSQARGYTWSSIEGEGNLHKGVFALNEEGWSGPRGANTPFVMLAIKVDTPDAYKTALANGGAEFDKKNPGKAISFLLEKVAKHPNPVWRVIWGESVSQSNFSVYVDASTGDFREKLR
jgi:hypothetical protein